MSELRKNKKAIEKLVLIENEIDTYQAIRKVIRLIENESMYEEKIPRKYDEKTGQPKSFIWKPYQKFEKKISLYDDGDIILSKEVKKDLLNNFKIKKNPLLIQTDIGDYLLNHRIHSYEASAHNDRWIQTDAFIEIIKIKNVLQKEK
ncbi:MAG: hypothetical protein AABX88_03165 [Nanoarchaeota archaeon]